MVHLLKRQNYRIRDKFVNFEPLKTLSDEQ